MISEWIKYHAESGSVSREYFESIYRAFNSYPGVNIKMVSHKIDEDCYKLGLEEVLVKVKGEGMFYLREKENIDYEKVIENEILENI